MFHHSFHFNRGFFKEGDPVYYRSPMSSYAIRKAKVVQVEERKHHFSICQHLPRHRYINNFLLDKEVEESCIINDVEPCNEGADATPVNVIPNEKNRGIRPDPIGAYIPYDVLTLDNGIVIEASVVFATRQEAEAELISELKEQLMFQQVELKNLKQKMAYEEKALRRLEQGLP